MPVITLEGLTKRYGPLKALNAVSLRLEPGAIGLLGPNGAGKSTLIKSLMGLVSPTSGGGTVLGLDIRRDGRLIRQRTGYMPEDDCHIAGLAAVEMVGYLGELAGLERRESLRRAHELCDYAGLAEERYREVQTYSTGMKQKVKLAQALIHDPELVFLDEPTNGMDPQGRDKMLGLIGDLARRRNVTVMLSSHLLHDIEQVCDTVVILGRGKLLTCEKLSRLQKTADESYTLHLLDPSPGFAEALRQAGCAVETPDPVTLKAGGVPNLPQMAFWLAGKHRAQIRQIVPGRNSLEEIFLQALAEESHAPV